jgi:predicted transcriptional regulator of viral defense system
MATPLLRPAELADWMLGRGQHSATSSELSKLLGVAEPSLRQSLRRQSSSIVSVSKGLWIPVPPEYRSVGFPPPIHFVDALMKHLGHPYYVGFLSAAQLHGASHQKPMTLQVVTSAVLRDRQVGDSRLQFIHRMATKTKVRQRFIVPTGQVDVSTAEVTVLDLAETPRFGAGIGNVATVIGELLIENKLDIDKLTKDAAEYPATVTQRIGYLSEYMAGEVGVELNLDDLAKRVAASDYTLLDPQIGMEQEQRNSRWKILANIEIEHDL